jgi:outer membrane protein assembly factor BamE (lipoprotein component of BamABCDE complex)
MNMKRLPAIILLSLVFALLGGCVQFESKRGVEVNWKKAVTDKLVKGRSARRDVLEVLGPPSQVIALDNESALYYLFEHSDGEGMILIVYNRIQIDTRYDRAIFFFDENDVLTDYATHLYPTDEG